MTTEPAETSDTLRQRVLERLEKRAEFRRHLAAYVRVNAVLVPVFRRPMTEDQTVGEIRRLEHGREPDDSALR